MSRVADAALVLRDLLNSQTQGEWFVGMARNTLRALDDAELRELKRQYRGDVEALAAIKTLVTP